ncbi:MAG: hypothetical protein LWY06_07690 [Firmicutes bacterium]|nr:hypothetical protein [Bacillota bacterium]
MNIDKTNVRLYTDYSSAPKTLSGTTASEKPAQRGDGVDLGKDEGGLKGAWQDVKDWVNANITGDDVGPGGKKSVARIVSDYSPAHKQMAAAGASAGGAIGAAIGLASGHSEITNDKAEVKWHSHDVQDQKLVGFTHWSHEVGHTERDYVGTDKDGNAQYNERYVVDGYQHTFSPDIKYTTVGSYSTPAYEHSNGWTHITAGLAGLAGGALFGGVIGFTISVINKTIRNHAQAAAAVNNTGNTGNAGNTGGSNGEGVQNS